MEVAALDAQAAGGREWSPPEGWHVAHEGLADEMHVGGVYLRLYMRNPQYPLRPPQDLPRGGSASLSPRLAIHPKPDADRACDRSVHS